MELRIKLPDKKKELSELSKRFMKVFEIKKYTGYRFSKDFPKLLEGTITKIRTGRVEPSKVYLTALLEKFPDLSNIWLLTGEGEMFNIEKQNNSQIKEIENKSSLMVQEPKDPYGLEAENVALKNELIETKAIVKYLEKKIANCICKKKQQTA